MGQAGGKQAIIDNSVGAGQGRGHVVGISPPEEGTLAVTGLKGTEETAKEGLEGTARVKGLGWEDCPVGGTDCRPVMLERRALGTGVGQRPGFSAALQTTVRNVLVFVLLLNRGCVLRNPPSSVWRCCQSPESASGWDRPLPWPMGYAADLSKVESQGLLAPQVRDGWPT